MEDPDKKEKSGIKELLNKKIEIPPLSKEKKMWIVFALIAIPIIIWRVFDSLEIVEEREAMREKIKEWEENVIFKSVRSTETVVGIKTNETQEANLKEICRHFNYGFTNCYFFNQYDPKLKELNRLTYPTEAIYKLEETKSYFAVITIIDKTNFYNFEENKKTNEDKLKKTKEIESK